MDCEGEKMMQRDFTELDDDQLRSAILNIADPKSELRRELINEANHRLLSGLDLTKTCQTGGAWMPFFKEIESPAWSNGENCPSCGKFEMLVRFKGEDLCVSCRNDKYPGWAEWWGFNTKYENLSYCTGCQRLVDRIVAHVNRGPMGFDQFCQGCAEKDCPSWNDQRIMPR
jgi:hypothetical protein